MRIILLVVLCLLFGIIVQAQASPTIEYFTVDKAELDYPAVEAGTESTNFSWRTVGLRQGDRMQMHAWVGGQWVLIGENFEPEKTDTLVIAHPLDFILPKYRLSVVDAGGSIAAEQILELAYTPQTELPAITVFLTLHPRTVISYSEIDEPLHIQWRVENRWFNSNLVFEQIMPDGTVRSAEYERPIEWQYAHRADYVRIVYPGDYADIVLRLRVVNRDDGSTLAQQDLVLAVEDSPAAPAELVHFSAAPAPVHPGENVTITWEVVNSDVVFIEFFDSNPNGSCAGELETVYRDLPISGSLEAPAPLYAYGGLRFRLFTDFYVGGSRHQCHSSREALAELAVDVSDYIGQGVVSFNVPDVELYGATFGDTITLAWEVSEGESVTIIQPDTRELNFPPGTMPLVYETYTDLPLTGTLDVTIPDDAVTRGAISRYFLLYIIEDGVMPGVHDASTSVLLDRDGNLDCDSFLRVEEQEANPGLVSRDVIITWDSCRNANTLLSFVISNRSLSPEEVMFVESSGTMAYTLPDEEGALLIDLEYDLEGERYRLQTTRIELPAG